MTYDDLDEIRENLDNDPFGTHNVSTVLELCSALEEALMKLDRVRKILNDPPEPSRMLIPVIREAIEHDPW